MKRALLTLAFFIGVAQFSIFNSQFSIGSIAAQLPAITLKTMDGQTVKTDTLNNQGKPFIISFFATWCKPCNRELSAIQEVYDEWKAETGVKLIAYKHNGYTDGAEEELIEKVRELTQN